MNEYIEVGLRGVFVATFLFSVGLEVLDWKWWVAMFSIHGFLSF